ncbi:hypothetical protein AAFF_G00198420 [Aldrovandia affinis]|uniref:Uncharacterized protein n=1 Tax=Aldrovandia affinis TaxID=143900 RepID=A0AAD7RL50_9TELE|nr:hypothetical protein AAFF_G00198420 [Aldrovandia affinis]
MSGRSAGGPELFTPPRKKSSFHEENATSVTFTRWEKARYATSTQVPPPGLCISTLHVGNGTTPPLPSTLLFSLRFDAPAIRPLAHGIPEGFHGERLPFRSPGQGRCADRGPPGVGLRWGSRAEIASHWSTAVLPGVRIKVSLPHRRSFNTLNTHRGTGSCATLESKKRGHTVP